MVIEHDITHSWKLAYLLLVRQMEVVRAWDPQSFTRTALHCTGPQMENGKNEDQEQHGEGWQRMRWKPYSTHGVLWLVWSRIGRDWETLLLPYTPLGVQADEKKMLVSVWLRHQTWLSNILILESAVAQNTIHLGNYWTWYVCRFVGRSNLLSLAHSTESLIQ